MQRVRSHNAARDATGLSIAKQRLQKWLVWVVVANTLKKEAADSEFFFNLVLLRDGDGCSDN